MLDPAIPSLASLLNTNIKARAKLKEIIQITNLSGNHPTVVETTIFHQSLTDEEYKKRIEDYIHLVTMNHSKNCQVSN